MERKVVRKRFVFGLAAALAWPAGAADTANAIAAIVNDDIITVGEVMQRAAPSLARARRYVNKANFPSVKRMILRAQLNQMIGQTLLKQAAQKKVDDTPELKHWLDLQVQKEIKRLNAEKRARGETPTEPDESWESRINRIRESLMMHVYMQNMVDRKVSVAPQEIRDYYNRHRRQFSNFKRVQIRRILIKFDHFKTREAAWERAREIERRIQAGEDFAQLARKYSHGPRARTDNPADAGLFRFDEVAGLKPKLRKIAMGMKEKQVSPIIPTRAGLEIIKVEKVQPARELPFEEAQALIRDKLKELRRLEKEKELVEKLWRDALVKRLRFND